MKISTSVAKLAAYAAGACALATLSGCVVAPLGPPRLHGHNGWAAPVYAAPPPAVVVVPPPGPPPRYYGAPRYRYWR